MVSDDGEFCPKHEWPRYQCPPECSRPSSGPTRWKASDPPDYQGPRPGPESILISATGLAHRLGCLSLPDYAALAPPKWGWTDSAEMWPRIGAHTLQATRGNTKRVAERRCQECDEQY